VTVKCWNESELLNEDKAREVLNELGFKFREEAALLLRTRKLDWSIS